MLNVKDQQKNVNQNHNETPFLPIRMATEKKVKTENKC